MKRILSGVGIGLLVAGVISCGGGAPTPSAEKHGPDDGHGHEAATTSAKCEHGVDAATCEKCKAEGHGHAGALKCEHGMDAAMCEKCKAEGHDHANAAKCEHGIDAAICAECVADGHKPDTGQVR